MKCSAYKFKKSKNTRKLKKFASKSNDDSFHSFSIQPLRSSTINGSHHYICKSKVYNVLSNPLLNLKAHFWLSNFAEL